MRALVVLPLLALGLAAPAVRSETPSPALRLAQATAPAEAVQRLAERLRRLEEDGLDPRDYGVPAEALAASDAAAFRAATYRAAQAALADLLHGRVASLPGRADLRRDIGAVPLGPWQAELAAAADPAQVIERAAMLHPEMPALKAELARHRARLAAASSAPRVPPVTTGRQTLEPGTVDPVRVPALRARLAVEDAAVTDLANPAYDDALSQAVQRFQAAEGLEADGRIGPITFAALNRPASAKVRQLRVAMDMRRAAASAGGERRIEVNVAHQRLQVLEGERELLAMAVIVGRPSRATPMLRVRMTAVQFNPPWGVPERNAREDLLPRFRRDPRAMMEKGFRVFTRVDGQTVEVDATTIDWRSVNPNSFPYFIRQDAGDANALGRIKFVMPNDDAIFMHDTPDRHLFRRPDRAFSSGCIRLERPMELLDLVLQGTPGWDRSRVDRALATRQTSGVSVGRSLPVRLHYTSVIVEGGQVRIRPDIYGLDEAYARAMESGRSRIASAEAAGPRAR